MSMYKQQCLKDSLPFKGALRCTKIHILGILGVSMSALALYLREEGFEVSGYDDDMSKSRENLTRQGINVYNDAEIGIADADAVIYSSAISRHHPGLLLAERLGTATYSRAEILGELMKSFDVRIGVSGTHGKSTTVGFIDRILVNSGMSPTVFSGAELDTGSTYRSGKKDFLIYEACEYRDAFLHFSPTYAIITNVELDHTDYFSDIRAVVSSFCRSTKGARSVIISADSDATSEIVEQLGKRAITFGKSRGAIYRYEALRLASDITSFCVYRRNELLGEFSIALPGEHNVMNALAAIALATELGISYPTVSEAVEGFIGVPRRLELLGNIGERAVYYDYAHHPTEIKASITALRSRHGKLSVIFRPHTYTRTRDLWDGFVDTLSLADHCIIREIYPARESPIEGISATRLAECIRGAVALDGARAVEYIIEKTDGAIVLMGAGALDYEKRALCELIEEKKT